MEECIIAGKEKYQNQNFVHIGDISNLKPPPLVSVGYTIDILGNLDYKDQVLELLSNQTQSNILMCELRMTFFVAAVIHRNREQCLMPFPSCFFDRVKKCKKFDEVVNHIGNVPKFAQINESTELPRLTWELLHWIFTNPLSLQPLLLNINTTVVELENITGLKFPAPNNITSFMFNITQTQPKKKFLEAKEKFGSTFFGFHGSELQNFHSIIHRGLVSALNVRSAYGFGTYLSSQLSMSNSYSPFSKGWSNSAFGSRMGCVAVCEVVSAPTVRKYPPEIYVCDNDDYMQLSHLFLFNTGY